MFAIANGDCCKIPSSVSTTSPFALAQLAAMGERLYHYTNAAGLLGILESRTIWATSVDFLNDAQELQYACERLQRELDDLVASARSDGPPRTVGDQRHIDYLEALRAATNASPDERSWRVYVTCFCEKGDLLSQWRAYGSDHGYALGLDAGGLESVTCSAGGSWSLARVRYGDAGAQESVDRVLREISGLLPAHAKGVAESAVDMLVVPLLPTIKHPTFREEQERRLICIDHRSSLVPQFRPGRFGVTPYVELVWPAAALREVIVGPGSHPDVRRRGVEQLLRQHGELTHVSVRTTAAPLRI